MGKLSNTKGCWILEPFVHQFPDVTCGFLDGSVGHIDLRPVVFGGQLSCVFQIVQEVGSVVVVVIVVVVGLINVVLGRRRIG